MQDLENINLSDYTLVNPSSIKKKKCNVTEFIDIEVEDDHTFHVLTENEDKILSSNSDGNHIRTLLLTFLFNNMRELIKAGHVYRANPPLFVISQGKNVTRYAYNDSERDKILNELKAKSNHIITVQRMKGLGEMNPEQLWNTTINPLTRTITKIKIDDEQKAEQMFKLLMGSDVPARKKFIEDNALNVKNLDV